MPTALADHLEQSEAPVVILLVGAEMIVQIVDTLGEDGHLHRGRTCVRVVLLVLLTGRGLSEGHVVTRVFGCLCQLSLAFKLSQDLGLSVGLT